MRNYFAGGKIADKPSLGGHAENAPLGAANLGDIGVHFPPDDARWRDQPSARFLQRVAELLAEAGYAIVNIDSTLIAQAPKMRPHIAAMRSNIAAALGIGPLQVSVKATTTENLGFAGRGEGIAADAVALIQTVAG